MICVKPCFLWQSDILQGMQSKPLIPITDHTPPAEADRVFEMAAEMFRVMSAPMRPAVQLPAVATVSPRASSRLPTPSASGPPPTVNT